jgi:hypothetical protein
MRVSADELDRIRRDVAKAGRRYSSRDLEGALIDCDYGLVAGGFTSPKVKKTGEPRQMVIYRCRPESEPETTDRVVARLESHGPREGRFDTKLTRSPLSKERFPSTS